MGEKTLTFDGSKSLGERLYEALTATGPDDWPEAYGEIPDEFKTKLELAAVNFVARLSPVGGEEDMASGGREAIWKMALLSISRNTCCDGCQEAARVAQTALEADIERLETKDQTHG